MACPVDSQKTAHFEGFYFFFAKNLGFKAKFLGGRFHRLAQLDGVQMRLWLVHQIAREEYGGEQGIHLGNVSKAGGTGREADFVQGFFLLFGGFGEVFEELVTAQREAFGEGKGAVFSAKVLHCDRLDFVAAEFGEEFIACHPSVFERDVRVFFRLQDADKQQALGAREGKTRHFAWHGLLEEGRFARREQCE